MPILPSGLTLGIGIQAIPEDVGIDWFKCPEGHFWYKRPDYSITPPPYDGTTQILEDWVNAPVPETLEEVKQYMYVLYRKPDGQFQWRGEWLNEFPLFVQLDDSDLAAWQEWLGSEACQGFLLKAIERCRSQAELNKQCSGVASFTSRPPASQSGSQ